MKISILLIAIALSLLVIPYILSEPSFNGSSPGCAGSGCHSFSDGIVSVTVLNNFQVEVLLSGTTSKVGAELVDENGNVVAFINSTTSNPFILTAPSEGTYTVNAGYKNPSRDWDSSTVSLSSALPPNAPSDLIAIVNQNPLSVELNWTDNSNNEEGFVIERDVVVGDQFVVVDTVAQDATSYTDTSVAILTFNYRVKAFNINGDSPYSDTAQVFVPVELTSFTASVKENSVLIAWTTATETNNLGFEVQRKTNDVWQTLDFIDGKGTSTERTDYNFEDNFDGISFKGNISYRLKQIDYDGTFSYSDVIFLEVDFTPNEFSLSQNYPNPFNPSTTIKYSLAVESKVLLSVYNLIGEKIDELSNGIQQAGIYNVNWNASDFASGIYYYRLEAVNLSGDFSKSFVKKMMLVK